MTPLDAARARLTEAERPRCGKHTVDYTLDGPGVCGKVRDHNGGCSVVRPVDDVPHLQAALAEVDRLLSGGCARNQGLTQFCAEAATLAAQLLEAERAHEVAWDEGVKAGLNAAALEVEGFKERAEAATRSRTLDQEGGPDRALASTYATMAYILAGNALRAMDPAAVERRKPS